jgi:hypothetical protein
MPPIRSRSSQKSTEQEGRILLAIQALKNKEIPLIRKAARRFNIPDTTLRRRLSGIKSRANSRANLYKLT